MKLGIAVLAVMLAAGCATASDSASGRAVPVASLANANDADRRTTAEADARHHLAEFTPPTGAHQIHGQPLGADALAMDPGTVGRTTANATTWWEMTSARAPADVVAAVAIPAGAKAGDSWGTGGTAVDTWTMSFDWPIVGQILISRQLLVTGTRLGDNVVLRVDGETTWVPNRPKNSLIPSGVASIVLTFQPPRLGPDPDTVKPYDPITVTDSGQIDTVVALVDGAPVDPYPVHSCPYAGGGQLTISFRSSAGTEIAQAVAAIYGCDQIHVQIGKAQTTLTGGRDLTNAVIAKLALPWQPVR